MVAAVWFVVLILLLGKPVSVHTDEEYDDFLDEIRAKPFSNHARSVDGLHQNKKLALAILSNRMCVDDQSSWKCKKDCRMEFYANRSGFTNLCHPPPPTLKCFGIPINYSYVMMEDPDTFPQQYSVLRHFPRCWKSLAPLICLSIYRPCAFHKFFQKDERGSIEEGVVELWARIRRRNCEVVRDNHCQDVYKLGSFPPWIQCEQSLENEGIDPSPLALENITLTTDLFSDSCRANSLPISGAEKGVCPFPLVGRPHGSPQGTPVIDSCYLPCRSAQIAPFLREYQSNAQMVLGFLLATIFLTEAIYLSYFSYIYTRSLIVFCLSHSLFSISVYLVVWALSSLSVLADKAECTLDGLRREDRHNNSFDWCVWQSWLLQSSFLCSFLWLLAHYMFSIVQPSFSDFQKLGRSQLRGVLIMSIYFPVGLFSVVIMWTNMREFDGVSGVCHVGLMSSAVYSCVFILPLIAVYIPLSIYAYITYRKRYNSLRREAVEDTRRLLRESEESNRKRRFLYATKVQGLSEDAVQLDDLRAVPWNDVLKAEEAGQLGQPGPMPIPNKSSPRKNSRYNGLLDRHRSMVNEEFDCFLQLQEDTVCAPDDLRALGVDELAVRLVEAETQFRFRWQYSVWHRWTVAAIVAAVCCLVVSLLLHPLLVGTDASAEVNNIKEYIRCGLGFALSHSAVWDGSHDGGNLSSPIPEFGGCQLRNPYSRYRADGVVLIFMVLPSIPFLILFVAFVAGCSGNGGMSKVRELRPDWSSLCCEMGKPLEEEVEMQLVPYLTKDRPTQITMSASQSSELGGPGEVETSFPKADSHRFASSEELRPSMAPESPNMSESASEPVSRSDHPADGHVRKLDLVSRMREHKRQRKEAERGLLKRKLSSETRAAIRMTPQEVEMMLALQRRARGVGVVPDSPTSVDVASSTSSLSTNSTGSMGTVSNYSRDMASVVKIVQASAVRDGAWSERKRVLVDCLRDLSAYMNYSNDMITNDCVAWTLVMDMVSRMEATLGAAFPPNHGAVQLDPANTEQLMTALRALHQEMTVVIPTVMNHTRNLTPWSNAVKDSLTTLRCATNGLRGPAADPPKKLKKTEETVSQSPAVQRQFLQAGASRANVPIVDSPAIRMGGREAQPSETQKNGMSEACKPSTSTANCSNSAPFANFGLFLPPKQPANVTLPVAPSPAHTVPNAGSNQSAAAPGNLPKEALTKSKVSQCPTNSGEKQQSGPQCQMESQPGCSSDVSISGYTESYSASPGGIFTRLSDNEIRLRITRLREISSDQLFPQELIYVLVLTGDIRFGTARPALTGDRLVTGVEVRALFGESPPIRVIHSPSEFLSFMRRRALTMVAAIGYHYSRNRADSQQYNPPVLPGFGLEEMENELVLGRILGPDALLPVRQLVWEFDNGRREMEFRPDLPLVTSFNAYFDEFCAAQGFPIQREEFVPDPAPTSGNAGLYDNLSDEESLIEEGFDAQLDPSGHAPDDVVEEEED